MRRRGDVLRSHFSIVIYECISCKYENLVHSLATWERHTKTHEWEQKQQLKIHHSLYIWEDIVYVKTVNYDYFQVNHSSADCTDTYIYICIYTYIYICIYIHMNKPWCLHVYISALTRVSCSKYDLLINNLQYVWQLRWHIDGITVHEDLIKYSATSLAFPWIKSMKNNTCLCGCWHSPPVYFAALAPGTEIADK